MFEKLRSIDLRAATVAAFIAFWAPVLIFFQIADEILESEPILFDEAILKWLYANGNQTLDSLFIFITSFGGITGMLSITIILVGYLIYRKKLKSSIFIALGVGGAALANVLLKAFFQRERPNLWEQLVTETSFSFPSGHAMATAAFFTCLVILYWHTKARWYVLVLAVIATFLVGLSRVYLGVHYPSDIIAGWSAGIVWVFVMAKIIKR